MATKVGVTSRASRAESMTRANNAIDSILANAAFDDKRLRLKKQYKQAERRAKSTGARVTARAESYSKASEGLGGLVTGINATNKQAQAVADQWEQAQKKAQDQWQKDFLAKPKFADLTGKKRQKAWGEYVTRQAKRLPEYNAYQDLVKQGKIGQARYESQQSAVAQQKARYEAMVKQQKRAYQQYNKAIARYNRFTTYVPYQPA